MSVLSKKNIVLIPQRSHLLRHPLDFRPPISVCQVGGAPTCWYNGTEQNTILAGTDGSMVPTKDLFVCARGASQVTVIDITSGAYNFYSPVSIPGVRFVAGPGTQ